MLRSASQLTIDFCVCVCIRVCGSTLYVRLFHPLMQISGVTAPPTQAGTFLGLASPTKIGYSHEFFIINIIITSRSSFLPSVQTRFFPRSVKEY